MKIGQEARAPSAVGWIFVLAVALVLPILTLKYAGKK